MWHTLSFVAESRRLDPKELAAFAMAHQDRYGIATDRGEPEVNTWYVDRLVADFKVVSQCCDWICPVCKETYSDFDTAAVCITEHGKSMDVIPVRLHPDGMTEADDRAFNRRRDVGACTLGKL